MTIIIADKEMCASAIGYNVVILWCNVIIFKYTYYVIVVGVFIF